MVAVHLVLGSRRILGPLPKLEGVSIARGCIGKRNGVADGRINGKLVGRPFVGASGGVKSK